MAKKKAARAEAFNLKKFYKRLDIVKYEQEAVADCLARGLEHYYRDLYGYDKYGRHPAFLIGERMYEPYIFGFGAVEVVRHDSLSLETRVKITQHAFEQTNVAAEYGTPHGLPAMLSFLAGVDRLAPPGFRSVMIAADFAGALFDDWQLAEVRTLMDWLIVKADVPGPERVWWLWNICLHCEQAQMCRSLADGLLAHPHLAAASKRELCEAWLGDTPAGKPPAQWQAMQALLHGDVEAFREHAAEAGLPVPDNLPSRQVIEADYDGALDSLLVDEESKLNEFGGTPLPSLQLLRRMLIGPMGLVPLTPGALKRAALAALPQLGDDPLAVCEKYLGSTRTYYADVVNGGVADILRAHHTQVAPDRARALIERALKVGQVGTRKAFYQLGADLFGDEYLVRAASDNAKSIREWAARKVSGPAKRGRKPRASRKDRE